MTDTSRAEGHVRDRVLIVTGAGRGIGRATAEALAREGARLVLVDLGCDAEGRGEDPSVVAEAVEAVRALGAEAEGLALDVAAPDAADTVVRTALERFGQVDGLFSAAGIRRDRGVSTLQDDDLQRTLEVGLLAPTRLLRAVSAALIDARRPGSIVLCAGPSAFFAAARQGASGAAFAGVVALARSAAVELRRHQIRVNVLVPTARTRLTEDLPLFRGVHASSMLPEHVAPVASFLLGDLGAEVHGEVVGVAGGRLYAFQSRETVGSFVEGRGFAVGEIGEAWTEVTRG
ncbi:MAG: SDR family oxidoreductase [Sandaracinus sp.]|nr:SDR family oxidoreductase [Myxococcales bacterium]MCB9611874.1 SDR family oxidoreductase [Sandaracinus sp.]MCB9620896.1 SDR family oxidoreductase [Sandaracinus sp.]